MHPRYQAGCCPVSFRGLCGLAQVFCYSCHLMIVGLGFRVSRSRALPQHSAPPCLWYEEGCFGCPSHAGCSATAEPRNTLAPSSPEKWATPDNTLNSYSEHLRQYYLHQLQISSIQLMVVAAMLTEVLATVSLLLCVGCGAAGRANTKSDNNMCLFASPFVNHRHHRCYHADHLQHCP